MAVPKEDIQKQGLGLAGQIGSGWNRSMLISVQVVAKLNCPPTVFASIAASTKEGRFCRSRRNNGGTRKRPEGALFLVSIYFTSAQP